MSFLFTMDYLGIEQKDIVFKRGEYIKLNNMKIPLDSNSNLIINFADSWGKAFHHYSYVDIIQSYIAKRTGEVASLDLSIFKDKICLVGLTAEGTTDLHPNPLESLYPAVGIHAEVFNSIIKKKFIQRASAFANLLIFIILFSLTIMIAFKLKPIEAFGILFGIGFLFINLCFSLFNLFGLWIDMFYPVAAMTFVYLFSTVFKYVAEYKAKIVMENELSIAKKIQESFLPKKLPEVKGFDIAARMLTARQVGGDLEFSDERLGVMVGDVTGKGVPASLFMAMVVGRFKFLAAADRMPEEAFEELNTKIIEESKTNLFVTMFYSIFDFKKKEIYYASGGHCPLLYLSKGEDPQFLDVEEGLPIGMIKGKYSGGRTKYKKDDIFIYYTDGVTEAANKKGDMYDNERLLAVTNSNRDKSAEELLDSIEKDVRKFAPTFRQQDDFTVIVIKITQ